MRKVFVCTLAALQFFFAVFLAAAPSAERTWKKMKATPHDYTIDYIYFTEEDNYYSLQMHFVADDGGNYSYNRLSLSEKDMKKICKAMNWEKTDYIECYPEVLPDPKSITVEAFKYDDEFCLIGLRVKGVLYKWDTE